MIQVTTVKVTYIIQYFSEGNRQGTIVHIVKWIDFFKIYRGAIRREDV